MYLDSERGDKVFEMDDSKSSMNIFRGFNNSTGLWSLIEWQ
jgi:hypothetical protein